MQLTPAMQLAVNELSERALAAQRLAIGMRSGSSDSKRPNAWCEYGFPSEVGFEDLYQMYERGGVPHGVVHRLLDKCWETMPEIIEGEPDDDDRDPTQWEKTLKKEFKRLKVWKHFKEADRMRLVGHYSGLLLQVADGQAWDQPLSAKRGVLVKLIPAWEGQLTPAAWQTDNTKPDYGEVTMWTFNEAAVKENDSQDPGRTMQIHPSRVFIVGDYRTGVPLLKAGFNDFITIEKVIGGAGESFLKNAARQLAISFDKETDMAQVAAAYGVPIGELHTAFDSVAKGINRGQDTVLGLQGAVATPLVATVPDPEPPFNVALQSACASVQIPAKVVVGMQTGERASTEDLRDFNKRGQGRRVGELAEDAEGFVAHLIRYRFLDAAPGDEFCCVWDDLSEATVSEKLANAKLAAEVNTAGLGTGDRYFSLDEIRVLAGFEPGAELDPLPESEPTDEELLGADPAAQGDQ